jgi:hypothetical protein
MAQQRVAAQGEHSRRLAARVQLGERAVVVSSGSLRLQMAAVLNPDGVLVVG